MMLRVPATQLHDALSADQVAICMQGTARWPGRGVHVANGCALSAPYGHQAGKRYLGSVSAKRSRLREGVRGSLFAFDETGMVFS